MPLFFQLCYCLNCFNLILLLNVFIIYFFITIISNFFFFFQAEDGIRDHCVTGVQTCALPIWTLGQIKFPAGWNLLGAEDDLVPIVGEIAPSVGGRSAQRRGKRKRLGLGERQDRKSVV